jgi:hypothetical protein
MPKHNYGQVKRQKEAARKARQQKKLDRRQARPDDSAATALAPAPGADDAAPAETPGEKSL